MHCKYSKWWDNYKRVEYLIYMLTGLKFTNVSMYKDHVQTAENFQILYANFHVLFKNIKRKIATKFLSSLVLSLALENFMCQVYPKIPLYVTIIYYRLFSSQS